MVWDFVAFLERPVVRRIVCAVVISYASVHLLRAVFQGFVFIPWNEAAPHDPFSNLILGTGQSVIAGRVVNWIGPVAALLTFALALLVAGRLWQDERRPTETCRHCTSDVPVGASVCWACTRELA